MVRKLLINITAVMFRIRWQNLDMKLSMSVPFRSENLVGSVILGKKPSDVIASK